MALPKKLSELCPPSAFYFIISMISIIIIFLQNIGNNNIYTIGIYSCNVPNTILVFILKVIYILFWTWILNLICKDGYTGISWLLVLLPFILLFILIGLMML